MADPLEMIPANLAVASSIANDSGVSGATVADALDALETYVDNSVTGLLDFQGSTDCSANPNYPAGLVGDSYVVSVAGKIGGASGKSVEVGDVYVASADNAGGTEASVGTSWFVLEHNLNGAVLVGGALGTPSSGTLTNCTGLPIASGVSGLGTGIATFLATPSSANLLAACTDETGTGSLVLSISPTFTGTIGGANLTLTGDLSVQGATTIGNASGDTLTINAAAWSIPTSVVITKTAESGVAETLMTWKVSDSLTTLELLNTTSTVSQFSPGFQATVAQGVASTAFVFNCLKGDSGTVNPNMLIVGRYNDGLGGGNQDVPAACGMLEIRNRATPGFNFTGGYNLQFLGGGTSPTVSAGAIDVVNVCGFDRINTRHAAAGNRLFAVQTERGSTIYVGDDAIDFAASTAIISVGAVDITITTTTIALPQKISKYNNITTAGGGVPAIYGQGRATGQTAANASVATYTVGAADASFVVSANVLITTSTTHTFNVTCAYTDEGNTARTLTLIFVVLAGSATGTIANAAGAVPYHGIPVNIRAKAGTAITIATTGTFTAVTYNVEGTITQVS